MAKKKKLKWQTPPSGNDGDMIKAKVIVTLKDGILDPQGKTILDAFPGVGIEGIKELQTGKYFEILFDSTELEEAQKSTKKACEKLLSNPVIEKYTYEMLEE